MKKLIFVNQEQFGYHIDTYQYCKYLKDIFTIVYICWDYNLPKIEMEGLKVTYVSRKGNILIRSLRFVGQALSQMNDKQLVVFIKYFKGISLAVRLLRPGIPFVLDIRTGSVHKNTLIRRFRDVLMKFETRFFRNITIISKSLAEKLGIVEKAHILPLGADYISLSNKTFNRLDLLYVGTLFNRNIEVTIYGFKQFYETFQNQIFMTYTIIGDGPKKEAHALRNLVSQYGLSHVVKVTGRIPFTDLDPYFNACNIGVSYVPLTDYYDCQPMTKTYEYLLSGMPVIATSTQENMLVINPLKGILVGDTAENFFSGLKTIVKKRRLFDSTEIRNDVIQYNWKNVVQNNFKVYLENIY
jgi:glycosyltransferase involved in cell wall biosynthesis